MDDNWSKKECVLHYIWHKNGLCLCLVMGMDIRIIQGTLFVATLMNIKV